MEPIEIQNILDEILEILIKERKEFSIETYKKLKGTISKDHLVKTLGIQEQMLNPFEETLDQYYKLRYDQKKGKIVCLRIALWLEIISRKLNLTIDINKKITKENEEIAIKQVRLLELIIRDYIQNDLGGEKNTRLELEKKYKEDTITKWTNNSDETGILSGTTFSELSNILLDKLVFQKFEQKILTSSLNITKKSQQSLKYVLEDIRYIRNKIAHVKRISTIQIKIIKEYYKEITNIINKIQPATINQFRHFSEDEIKKWKTNLKIDENEITSEIKIIKEGVKEITKDSQIIKKAIPIIKWSIIAILITSGTMLFILINQKRITDNNIKETSNIKGQINKIEKRKESTQINSETETEKNNNKDNNIRVAILYFNNLSEDKELEMLKKGIAHMLISDLSKINILNIVERDRLEEVIKEQNLNNTKEFDTFTATKIGKLLGAEIILTGSYFQLMSTIRMDARFIEVKTGKILKSDGVDGEVSTFFKLQKQLSWKIINNLNIKITEEEKLKLEKTEKENEFSIIELNEYSKALNYYDLNKHKQGDQIIEKLTKKQPNSIFLKKL